MDTPSSRLEVEPPAAGAGVWLVFADQGGIGERMAQRLTRRGDRCVLIRASPAEALVRGEEWEISPWSREHYSQLAEGIRSSGDELAGILYCWGLDLAGSPCDPDVAVDAAVPPLFMTALTDLFPTSRRRALWMVTRGAQGAGGTVTGEGGLMQSPLWGVGRTLAMELPEQWGGIVDLSVQPEDAELDELEAVVKGLRGVEDQLALRGVERYAARLAAAPAAAGGAGELELSNRGVYLITGGLGALGLQTARWLAARGARELLLVGRRAPGEEACATVRRIEDRGARVTIAACDVADAESLRSLLSDLRGRGGAIAGVIHAAGVAGYQPLESLDAEAVRRVMAAKVCGGWLLHRELAGDDLDFFIAYSSISATWGSRHQAHYAAANTFLDALARFRTGVGLPAHSIAWGPWDGGGLASEATAEQYARMGLGLLSAGPATEILGALVAEAAAERVVADLDWRVFLAVLEARRCRPFFSRFAAEDARGPGIGDGPETPSFLQELAAIPDYEQPAAVEAMVAEAVAQVLGYDGDSPIDPGKGLTELGMDSLMATEIVQRLRRVLGRRLPATLAYEHPSIDALTEHLCSLLEVQLLRRRDPRAVAPAAADEPIAIVGMACRFPGGADTPE
ncbi:MAG: SDR family NAD(P)-dependent oxidoreductase, partial [bacterium]|nr:SDR family NAD(P)-dependent oxidoreductase [bacterium]